jgi:hypothetical protein
MSLNYVLWQNETMHGPFAAAEIKRMFEFGEVGDGALVAEDGRNDWTSFETRKVEILAKAELKEHTCSRCGQTSLYARNTAMMQLRCKHCATPLAQPLIAGPASPPQITPPILVGPNLGGQGWFLGIGLLLLIGGGLGALYFFFGFDTSVATEMGGRVNNLGLISDRQNGVIVSIGAAIVGAILILVESVNSRKA